MKLLDVAAHDARIDLLRHQLASLPEIREIADLNAGRGALSDRARDMQVLVDDLVREQKKADLDVEQVKTRRERDRTRMDQGLITNPKDLERMTHELESLERRISNLEDAELEVMERLEEAQAALDEATTALTDVEAKLAVATAAADEKAAAIKADATAVTAVRAASIEGMPADLMALYERIRAQKGVGAAELRARQCGGCRLTLNAADLAVIAKAASDEVVRCEECERILVRTAESGL